MKQAFLNLRALCKAQKEPSNIAALAILVEENDGGYKVSQTMSGTKAQLAEAVAYLIEKHPDIVTMALLFLKAQERIKN